jgi:hypothetical protein
MILDGAINQKLLVNDELLTDAVGDAFRILKPSQRSRQKKKAGVLHLPT